MPFIYTIMLYAATSQCPATVTKNFTDTWNNQDLVTLRKATKRCAFYFPRSPCLKLFIKVNDLTYRAVCGAKEKR